MGLGNFINSLSYPSGQVIIEPPQPPENVGEVVAYVMSISNKFVDVYFDRPVYNSSSSALTTSDFQLTDFVAGGVTVISIASVKKPDHYVSASATNLAGGESVIRFFLTLTGTADSTESFRIKVVADAIYDEDGNIMAASKSTGTINLNITPFTLWDAELDSTITSASLGISAMLDVMGNVNLAQATDADRPLHYLGRAVQFDVSNTEFLTGGTNASFQKQQADDFAIVIKDIYFNNNQAASQGWVIAYFNPSNNHGWMVRQGAANNSLNITMFDNSAANLAVVLNTEDQRYSLIIQNVSGVLSIYDENNNRIGSQGTTSIGTIVWTSISLHIGRRQTAGGTFFNGDWAKLSFYNQSLSSAQRLKIFANLNKVKSYATATLTKYLYPVINGSITAAHKDTMQIFLGGVVYVSGTYYICYSANAADGDVDRCFLAKLTTETPFTPATKVLTAGEPKVIIGPSGSGTWKEDEVFHRSLVWDPDDNNFKHYLTGSQQGATPQYTIGLFTSPDCETCTEHGQIYTDGLVNIITIAVIRIATGDWKAIVTTAAGGGATNNFSYDLLTSTDGIAWTKVGAITQFSGVILVMHIVKIQDEFFVLCNSDGRDSDPSLASKIIIFKTDFTTYTYHGELMHSSEPSERSLGVSLVIPFEDRIVGFYSASKNQNKASANGGEPYGAIRMFTLDSGEITQPNVVESYPPWVKFYWPLNAESATGNVFTEKINGGTCTYGASMQWTNDGLNLFDFLGTGATFSAISIAGYTADFCMKMRVEIVLAGTITLFTIGTDIVIQLVSGNLRVALNNATKDYITTADIAKPVGITDPGNHVYVGFIWQGGTLRLCVGNVIGVAVTQTVNNSMTDITNSGTTPVFASGATIELGRPWAGSGQTDQQYLDTDL